MRVAQPAPPRGCQLVVHRLTAQSRGPGDAAGRTYRCYPLVDGQSLRDRAGTYTPDSPDTGSPDAQGSPDADVSPGRRPCEQRTDLDSSLSESTLPAPVSSLIINASKVLVYAISPEWSTQPVTKQRAKTQPKQTPERAHTHTHTCTPIPPPPTNTHKFHPDLPLHTLKNKQKNKTHIRARARTHSRTHVRIHTHMHAHTRVWSLG